MENQQLLTVVLCLLVWPALVEKPSLNRYPFDLHLCFGGVGALSSFGVQEFLAWKVSCRLDTIVRANIGQALLLYQLLF